MNTRRRFLAQGGMAATTLFVSNLFKCFAGYEAAIAGINTTNNSITLMHTSGMCNTLDSGADVFHRTAGMIAGLRKQNKNSLLFDTGHDLKRENHKALAALNYDAVLPENFDGKHHQDILHMNFHKEDIPLITAYYGRSKVAPYTIARKGNIRIGIIGADLQREDMTVYRKPVKDINALAAMLKESRGCNIVICLSGRMPASSAVDNRTLAAGSESVDVILGSRSMHEPVLPPLVVLNKNGHEVIISAVIHGAAALSSLQIGFDEQGRKNHIAFNNTTVTGARES